MLQITPFSLTDFERLLPLLRRSFPEFWGERLGRNLYSFPYDVELFTLESNGEILGCIGIHPYCFLLEGERISCGGISDVAVAPEERGKGYAKMLLSFAEKKILERYSSSLIPLYTDKEMVYYSSGFCEYRSNREKEIRMEDFPIKEEVFTFAPEVLELSLLSGARPPEKEREKKALSIMEIYEKGREFPGKCLRTPKLWQELFADPKNFFLLEGESFFLYREGRLLEGYSSGSGSKVNDYTPCRGGHDANKVMIKFSSAGSPDEKELLLRKYADEQKLIFPIADTF